MSFDLVCLSHLRWDFVYQRPQHLLSRCARQHRVFFVEEPTFEDGRARLDVSEPCPNVWVVRPHLPGGLALEQQEAIERSLINRLFASEHIQQHVLWYYTPMALGFTRHLVPLATVYDCMDELSLFASAPTALRERERELFQRADVVFTGGQSLYEAKRECHEHIYAFPSSVDTEHFARARSMLGDPCDQRRIPHPRLGFYGVIDERLDRGLLAEMADLRPEWQFILLGPVVKIEPQALPGRRNIHYLGSKDYAALPAYLSGWDVAMMPFARNDATRFISPTKTLEYLAGGKPVVSTPIADVVAPYGEQGLVHIAGTAAEFVAAAEAAIAQAATDHVRAADAMLASTSWDRTWSRMAEHIEAAVEARLAHVVPLPLRYTEAETGKGGYKQDIGRVLPFPLPTASKSAIGGGKGRS